MEREFVDRAFQECGNDLDTLINRITQLDIGSYQSDVHHLPSSSSQQVAISSSQDSMHPPHHQDQDCVPRTGSEWVELFVLEITTASCMNEAKERTSRLLEVLEKNMNGREAVKILEKENLKLKYDLEKATGTNIILKRVVLTLLEQHSGVNKELEKLRQLVAQQEQKWNQLEKNNYVLKMHLNQAMMAAESKNIPSNYRPDL
ncbi:uncharacterized protein LOC113291417 [Papaver somniferum]|uniref:uncharacterized protein LOC113291417 n=1 Tax=Papaver somniferum TaxID=3469 RepID=UPI000E7059C4|nr:uncharacterized protein LOC113291417 [Papaver somniferum]